MQINLRIINTNDKANLRKVVIVLEENMWDEDAETISLETALIHFKNGVKVFEINRLEAGFIPPLCYETAINRISCGKADSCRPRTSESNNWLFWLSQYCEAYSVAWNKSGIEL
ncbi:hypothetical protein [Vibrio sp. 10N.239.312.D08]|uniref:hypothetical protein n=1 Tax=Vibrio sp. 10N.239.312.D08 TaxID=3229978 RepID=UPI00354BEDBC